MSNFEFKSVTYVLNISFFNFKFVVGMPNHMVYCYTQIWVILSNYYNFIGICMNLIFSPLLHVYEFPRLSSNGHCKTSMKAIQTWVSDPERLILLLYS